MANVVKKHSISHELEQKTLNEAVGESHPPDRTDAIR